MQRNSRLFSDHCGRRENPLEYTLESTFGEVRGVAVLTSDIPVAISVLVSELCHFVRSRFFRCFFSRLRLLRAPPPESVRRAPRPLCTSPSFSGATNMKAKQTTDKRLFKRSGISLEETLPLTRGQERDGALSFFAASFHQPFEP